MMMALMDKDNGKKIIISLFIILITMFIISCANEDDSWQDAVNLNSIEGYEEYLGKYPEGKYSQKAKTAIEEIIWDNAMKQDKVKSYENYLEKYPNGKYSEEAKIRHTEKIYQEFPKLLPNGIQIVSAKRTYNFFDYEIINRGENVFIVLELIDFSSQEIENSDIYLMINEQVLELDLIYYVYSYVSGENKSEEAWTYLVWSVPLKANLFELHFSTYDPVTFMADEEIYFRIPDRSNLP